MGDMKKVIYWRSTIIRHYCTKFICTVDLVHMICAQATTIFFYFFPSSLVTVILSFGTTLPQYLKRC